MKYRFFYFIVFTIFISHLSFQVTATELCSSSEMYNPEKPLMGDEEPEGEEGEEEEEEEPDCDE